MTGDCCLVHNYHTVANHCIMGNMTARHKQPVIPNARNATAARRAGVHRHVLANAVPRTNDQLCLFARKFKVLWDFTNA